MTDSFKRRYATDLRELLPAPAEESASVFREEIQRNAAARHCGCPCLRGREGLCICPCHGEVQTFPAKPGPPITLKRMYASMGRVLLAEAERVMREELEPAFKAPIPGYCAGMVGLPLQIPVDDCQAPSTEVAKPEPATNVQNLSIPE